MNATVQAEAPLTQEQDITAGSEETHIREVPGSAGHGPARAYGYIALAQALGAQAELTAGGTRSTGKHPLQITVHASAELFGRINDLYDEIAPVAEKTASEMRLEARRNGSAVASYDISLLTRAVLAGFPLGAASALREPGTTKPAPLCEATRARKADEQAYRSAAAAGRKWAARNLPVTHAGTGA
jgi:hypothetical protein